MQSSRNSSDKISQQGLPERDWSIAVDLEVEAEVERLIPAGFVICSAETAGWVVRKITEARRYGEQVKVWGEIERRRAEAEERRLLYLFGSQLEAWACSELSKIRGKRKSVALPGGTVGFRETVARIVLDDELSALAWAKTSCPAAVVVEERLNKTRVKEHFERTGELPPGMSIMPKKSCFFVR